MSNAALEIQGLSKRFRGDASTVLEDFNLTVGKGEFVCVVGASGCGKSTLLNLVAGLDVPTGGEIRVTEKVALIFQESALFPWLSAGKNVEMALLSRGVPRGERREVAQELLELVHLGNAYDKKPHELSGGMKQRVAIARALAQDASILLLDEPFASLDAITRDFLHEEISSIWSRKSLTIVFVTHNVREAVRLGQRVVLLSSRPGQIINEWAVDLPWPRQIDDPHIANLAQQITSSLRQEIARHG